MTHFAKFSAVKSILVAICAIAFSAAISPAAAQSDETWYRQPAISPDGSTILFSAHGDLWRVPSSGGTAVPLTRNEAWDGFATWSRDGSRIAFASERFGNLDIFVMNADGSDLTRLTFHDAHDVPSDFSPDGARVLFSSPRTDSAASSYFPTRALPELYEISTDGGAPRMVFTNPAREARWSPDGSQIVYREEKAYETDTRQRDVSSFARDIWVYDVAAGTHQKITDNPAGDHAPTWSADGTSLYMQSEIDGGSFNVRRVNLATGESETLTQHGPHAARNLSSSDDELLAYSYHGVMHTVRAGEAPNALDVQLSSSSLVNAPQPVAAPSAITEFSVSADGSEIVFVSRGEVFVTDAEFADTVRVTNTPEQERSVSFSPDGRSVLYAAERDGGWAIYETSLNDANEPRFSAAANFAERMIYRAEDSDAFQPQYSPDGEKVAFLRNRDAVWAVNRDGTNARVVFPANLNYSYSDGDISFDWSPDSEWITADFAARGNYFFTEIGVAPADGSALPRDISVNGYYDGGPIWHAGGEVVLWYTDRYGERTHGSWGSEGDIVAAFLTEGAWQRFNLTDQERALLSEHSASEEGEEESTDEEEEAGIDINAYLNLTPTRGEDDPIEIDFDGIENRTARLTMHSSDLYGAALTNDLTALYYLAAFEGGYDLWRHKLAEGETTKVASISASEASLQITADDAKIVILADGTLLQGAMGDEIELAPVALGGEVTVQADAERAYMFEHVWRQVNDKFHDPDFHGVDWPAMHEAFVGRLPGVSNNRDFANLVSEMLGQLNASHTGMYYRPSSDTADQTAALGAIFDIDGTPGLLISEVLDGGPLDRSVLDLEPGDRIIAIGDTQLDGTVNPSSLLNRRAGQRIRLTLAGNGRSDPERSITVRTYSRGEENQALYERWIERRREIVETYSGGRIGYVHIRSMNDAGYRQIYTDLLGRNFDKEAVVIDTRFNGGGWLHDDLITLLSGEPYFGVGIRGRVMEGAPEERWTRPSAVVMNEGNYSNAHMFPYVYELFNLGELVGMPVPGTGTAVWWESMMTGDIFFGIPQVSVLDQEGQPLENQELQPDILVDNSPETAAAGGDSPLEAAVDALIAELDGE